MALRPGSSGGPLVDRLGRAIAVVTAGTRDASGVTFAIRIDAAVAAFPQLQPWAASAVRGPQPPAQGLGSGPTERMARTDPDPGAAEVAPLAGEGTAARPAEVVPEAARMITVWEAPRPVRCVAARPASRWATVPCHAVR